LYAVVRTGGKQYRVEEGRSLKVERLPGEPGEAIELSDVLLLDDAGSVTVGTPVIEGARVLGTIAEQGRARKILVFKYKSKTRSRKKNGHRQLFTRLVVNDILAPGAQPRPKAEKAAPAEAAAPEAEAAPKPRRRASATTPAEAADEKPKRTRKKAE
jgi:large subunit ribosomal protein L21